MELLVVLAVTVVLTGLLLPALSQVRANADRVITMAQLRDLGLLMTMYTRDEDDRLPYSELLMDDLPLELMAAHIGDGPERWDGLGLLYSEGYCSAVDIYYSRSYRGEHTVDVYEEEWLDPGKTRIYTNYHYCGHVDWEDHRVLRRLEEGEHLILATDGFRTVSDLTQKSGMSMLRADGSVRWRELSDEFVSQLPPHGMLEGGQEEFFGLWADLEDL